MERRYQINLVVTQTDKDETVTAQRYKITLNRSEIINIEAMEESDAKTSEQSENAL